MKKKSEKKIIKIQCNLIKSISWRKINPLGNFSIIFCYLCCFLLFCYICCSIIFCYVSNYIFKNINEFCYMERKKNFFLTPPNSKGFFSLKCFYSFNIIYNQYVLLNWMILVWRLFNLLYKIQNIGLVNKFQCISNYIYLIF